MNVYKIVQMPKDSDTRLQRPQITPSSRPSIHSSNYSSSYSQLAEMVGPSKTRKNIEDQDSDGYDEPDNIMSKFSKNRTISPKIRRKNSVDIEPNKSFDDFTDDKIFSTSLPAYLPSHLNCSEVSPEQHLQFSPKYSKHNKEQSRKTNTPPFILESSRYSSDNSFDSSSREEKTSYFKIILVLIIALIAGFYQFFYNMESSRHYVYDESTFYNDLNIIGNKYGINGNSVLQIQTGISAIYQKQDAGSFIFVYNSNKNNFNYIELQNFMEAVATSTAKYLRNESETVQPIIDIAYGNIRSDSELITKYRDDVSKSGVMLVKEVDNVPSSLAMAFHYYCDEYNPVVKKSAIFFTLDIAKCPTNSADQKPNQSQVERCLARKWTSVPKDNIGPLLTRVVDVVVDVTSLK